MHGRDGELRCGGRCLHEHGGVVQLRLRQRLLRQRDDVHGVDRPVRAGSALRLLVASLRSADDLARLAAEGLDTFTISPSIAAELFAVEPTLAAADQFERDALGC